MQSFNKLCEEIEFMKKTVLALTLGVSLIGLSACSSNDVVVETESGNITQEEFQKELVKANGASVLEQMIQSKLLKDNYSVTEKEVEKEFKKVKSQFSSDEEFASALESSGITDEKIFKEQIELALLQKEAMSDGVKVDDKKLKKYFDENKDNFVSVTASHILVEDEATAKDLKKQIDEGADFAKLAKEKSTDTASAQNGGDIGEFKKADMVAEFSDVAFSMKENTISDPVKSQYGYHIIKVTKRTQKTIEKNKEEIKDTYISEKSKPIAEVMSKLKEDAKIDIKNEDLKKAVEKLSSGQ